MMARLRASAASEDGQLSGCPLQVEREIVKPLEEALSTLSGVKKLTSTANADAAQLNLEFSWGQSIGMIRLKVGEKIDQIRKDHT